jgi:DNA-binding MarR family transcriptional regulator
MPSVLPELTDHLGYWLRQVSNHVSHSFARKLAARDVTVAEWALLRMLYGAPPPPPSRLADKMGLTRGAVSKLADRLIAKDLIVRTADPQDGRAQTLALTNAGAGFVPELAALADANEAECFDAMPPADRRALERILKDYLRRLGGAKIPLE